MNIHFNNEALLKALEESSLVKLEVGSGLYGLNNQASDSDIFHIHAEAHNLTNSFLWEHHQLQMKKNNKDYLFSSLHLFLRNLISGDSCINFEILHSKDLEKSSLSFLYNHKEEFYNYNIAKAYLGFAKRDLKSIIHDNGFVNYKKLSHVVRSVTTCQAILNHNYDNVLSNYKQEYNLIKNLKEQNFSGDINLLIKNYEEKTSILRNEINLLLDSKKLIRALNIDFMNTLDLWLEELVESNDYKSKSHHLNVDKTLYYKVLEEGLKYS